MYTYTHTRVYSSLPLCVYIYTMAEKKRVGVEKRWLRRGDEIRIPAQIFRARAWKISNQLSPRSLRDSWNTPNLGFSLDTGKEGINSFTGFMPVIREMLYPLYLPSAFLSHRADYIYVAKAGENRGADSGVNKFLRDAVKIRERQRIRKIPGRQTMETLHEHWREGKPFRTIPKNTREFLIVN